MTTTAPDLDALDALCARLRRIASGEWTLKGDEGYLVQAAAALAQLRDAEALARGKIAEQMIEIARLNDHYESGILCGENDCEKHAGKVYMACVVCRAERAEAEVARLKERLEARFKRLTSMDGLLANAEAGRKEQTMAADMIAEERDAYARACKSLIAQVVALEAEVARLKQWQVDMVAKAADKSLDGYRELGAKCAALEAERDALRSALRKWAVSRHTNKCYICDWSWSEGAPQIHSAECLCYGGTDNDN
jgi:chromosome segregation ATPase